MKAERAKWRNEMGSPCGDFHVLRDNDQASDPEHNTSAVGWQLLMSVASKILSLLI